MSVDRRAERIIREQIPRIDRSERGAVAEFDDLAGREVEGCLLSRVLGHGADGIVYAAKRDGREVAVKLFFPSAIAKNGPAETRERLELQLDLIGTNLHPNLVEVYAGGEAPQLNTLYLVMELVPGTSLDKLDGKIPPETIPTLAGQLADVARALEAEGLVHRDIKPANIVISDDFKTLTLLDLGIIHQMPAAEDENQERRSGMEFVATPRYSPPEFVWRQEQEDADGAWRAVTFYQIGATLHDMIMGKPLFTGYDKPRVRLYDAVRDHTPEVASENVPGWLIQTVQSCLLKEWRQRLQFVCWEDFFEPTGPVELHQREKRIRLRQLRSEEIRLAKARQVQSAPGPTREQQLWLLNNAFIGEIRTYLLNTPIFPKSRVSEEPRSQQEYVSRFTFESDESRDFPAGVVFSLHVAIDPTVNEATKLSFSASIGEVPLSSASWTEMFTVETALGNCRGAFLDTVETMLKN